MTPEEWERLQARLLEALDLPPEDRPAFVEAVCRDDVTVGRELRSFLESNEGVPEAQSLPAPWASLISGDEPPSFHRGDRVAGRYRIESLLGRGGMGEVYEAWDEELSIPVALKTLHLKVSTEEARRRLEMEGLLARTVWHPNVCRLYDLGSHGDGDDLVWFLTMELLRGRTLADLLEREQRLETERALILAEQMAAGLGAAHRSGIVHRDFKPANVILVDRENGEQAVVTDFGIARAESAASGSSPSDSEGGPILGTPTYMAPEQLRGGLAGAAADIYALGVVLFEMVTGRLPFSDDHTIDGIAQNSARELAVGDLDAAARRLHQDAPSPRALRPELNEHWERAIRRCLDRDPARRFARAEEVAEALAGRAPALEVDRRPLSAGRSHSLPAERDPFVSRDAELDGLTHDLSKSRLVTLVGAAGMGKTRLAIRIGWQTLRDWPGGVWFSDLTEARDEETLALGVARALGVELRPIDPVAQIGHALAARGKCLVILDNFEQLLPHGAPVVARWLARATEARFLVTSRQRLALEELELVQRAEALSPEAGLELFQTRARRLRPGFECTGPDAEAAREIVRLVDGLPLAIELAAGRIRVMSVTQIVSEMRRRFSLLTGGGSARHATLAEAFEGSWELLSPAEKSAWSQFSVFEGGFTLGAADAILDHERTADAPKAAELLASLVEKNLLRTSVPALHSEASAATLRFGMLASLQEYARTKLRAAADEATEPRPNGDGSEAAALRRHGEYYARMAKAALPWRDLESELGNFTQACRRAVGREDCATAVAALRACQAVISRRGPYRALLDLGLEVLEATTLDEGQRAWVLLTVASAETPAGLTASSVDHCEAALTLYRSVGDQAGECEALSSLALPLLLLGRQQEARTSAEAAILRSREIGAGRPECVALGFLGELNVGEGRAQEARENWERALSIARSLGERGLEASNLINLGTLYFDDAKLQEAERCFQTALEIEGDAGGRLAPAIAMGNLGLLYQMRGELDEALVRLEGALAIYREVGYRRYEAAGLVDLGNLHRERGDIARARACLENAISIQREAGNRALEGRATSDLGLVELEDRRLSEAEVRFETALAIARDTHDRLLEGMTLYRVGALRCLEGRTEEARSALWESEAILRTLGELFELARMLCVRADLELARGDRTSAATFFDEAVLLANRTGSGPLTEIGRMVATLRGKLGTLDSD
ncbi:MAG: tetratricopeptide repeat protein [Candidatus Eisenbacteria bacterium]